MIAADQNAAAPVPRTLSGRTVPMEHGDLGKSERSAPLRVRRDHRVSAPGNASRGAVRHRQDHLHELRELRATGDSPGSPERSDVEGRHRGLMKAILREFAPHAIRIDAVAPRVDGGMTPFPGFATGG